MKYVLTPLIAVAAVILLAAPATADWDPEYDAARNIINHKMHFPQMPDKTDNGVDVLGTFPYPFVTTNVFGKILADDWKCSQTGPVTDIHIWSSWLYDVLPVGTGPDGTTREDPRAVGFKLSIHDNIPADPGDPEGGYSRPGQELWRAFFNPFDDRVVAREYATNVQEMFWDPNPLPDGEELGSDSKIWQYNFFMKPEDTDIFRQTEGEIYWLDVMAILPIDEPSANQPLWGWKTADRLQYPLDPDRLEKHYEDDAAYADIVDPYGPADPSIVDWRPLKYPSFHEEFQGQSMDLAFVITPEPGTVAMLIGAGLIGLVAFARRRRKS